MCWDPSKPQHVLVFILSYDYCVTPQFIHSSLDEHSYCFYILTVMVNSEINICLQISVAQCFSFFLLDTYLGTEFLGHMVIQCWNSWGTKALSTVAVPFYIPTHNVWGFLFLHLLANAYFFVIVIILFVVVWSGVTLWFWFAFPSWLIMLCPFLSVHLHIFFGKMLTQALCPFKKLHCLVFHCWVIRVLHMSWIPNSFKSLYSRKYCKWFYYFQVLFFLIIQGYFPG